MDNNQHINFWEQRDFGTLIGAPFYFLRQEFKPFSLMLLKYAGPFLAVAMLGLGLFTDDWFGIIMQDFTGNSAPEFGYMFLFLFFLAVGFLAAFLLTNSYIALYVKAGKDEFSEADILDLAKQKALPMIGLGLLVIVMVFFGMLLFYIPGIYLAIALSFVYIALIYEDLAVGESISRSFQVIKGKWWITFALILVFGMIVGFTSYIFFIPGYLVGIIALATDSFGIAQMVIVAVFAVLYFAVYLYMMALQQVLVAFQYFNILTEKEGGNLDERIHDIYDDNYGRAEVIDEEENSSDEQNDNADPTTNDETKDDDYNRYKKPDERNRFADDDDDLDPYKPKY